MKNIPTWQLVVAAAIHDKSGRWLMQKRPDNKHHGGLWEFPGGKVEAGELPVNALIRELDEELGIGLLPVDIQPACFAQTDFSENGQQIVILLYSVDQWTGQPKAIEGALVDWFLPTEVERLARPPLDVMLTRQLFRKTGP